LENTINTGEKIKNTRTKTRRIIQCFGRFCRFSPKKQIRIRAARENKLTSKEKKDTNLSQMLFPQIINLKML